MAAVLAAVVSAEMADGVPRTTLTDEQVQGLVAMKWTEFAQALLPLV